MAYIRKIIGSDEKLIGIARLHWIYILKGLLGFLGCAFFGWALNAIIFNGISLMARGLGRVDPLLPLLTVNTYLMPLMLGLGIIIFLSYFLLVISTEIGLTSRRLIHKKGLIFVNMHETDIEEIRAENLDTGYFGRFLNYGYINLDCRFIGDVGLPAIENANGFLKALHKVRSSLMDSLAVITAQQHPQQENKAMFDSMQEPPAPEQPAEPQPSQPQPETPQPPSPAPAQPERPPEYPVTPPQTPAPPPQPEIPAEPVREPDLPSRPMEIPPAPSEIPAQPNPDSPLPATNPPMGTSAIDPQVVAKIVEQVVPEIVEKITEEIADHSSIAIPDAENENSSPTEEELIESFEEVSSTAQKRKISRNG